MLEHHTNTIADLNRRQREVLSKLAWGWSYPRIQTHFGISQANLHTIAHQIRKKTGIQNTKNAEECRNWQRGHRPTNPTWYQPQPTPRQVAVMRLRAEGLGYPEIGERLSIGAQTAQDQCSQGCKRAKVGGAKHNRIYALRLWLKTLEPAPTPDPLDDF